MVAGAYPGSSGRKVDSNPRQDSIPLQGALTPILRPRQCRHQLTQHSHILDVKERREPAENPCRHRESAHSTQAVALARNQLFFSHQR